MSINLIDISAIENRLQLLPPEVCGHVGRVFVGDEITDGSGAPVTPSVWVYPEETIIDGPEGLGRGRIVTERIAVACVVGAGVENQLAADTRLRTLRTSVADLLEGWSHARRWAPLRYDGGIASVQNDAYIVWVESYITSGGNFAAA